MSSPGQTAFTCRSTIHYSTLYPAQSVVRRLFRSDAVYRHPQTGNTTSLPGQALLEVDVDSRGPDGWSIVRVSANVCPSEPATQWSAMQLFARQQEDQSRLTTALGNTNRSLFEGAFELRWQKAWHHYWLIDKDIHRLDRHRLPRRALCLGACHPKVEMVQAWHVILRAICLSGGVCQDRAKNGIREGRGLIGSFVFQDIIFIL